MHIMSRKNAIIAVASFLFIITALDFLITNDTDEIYIPESTPGIRTVNARYSDNLIYVDVYLRYPLTCKDVVDILGVQAFNLDRRLYVPSCRIINSELIQIVYSIQITT